jgi:hypothetical protein
MRLRSPPTVATSVARLAVVADGAWLVFGGCLLLRLCGLTTAVAVERPRNADRADVEMDAENRVVLAAEALRVPALAVWPAIEPEFEAIGRLFPGV